MKRFIASFISATAFAFASAACSGGVEYDARLGDTAAIINGEKISFATLALFEARLKKAGKFRGRARLLDVFIKNRLVANEYRHRHGDSLDGGHAREVEQEFRHMVRDMPAIVKALRTLPALIRREAIPNPAGLRALFGSEPAGKAARKGATLIRIARTSRANPNLLAYEIPGGERGRVSLNDVLNHENPHGRARIRRGDSMYVKQKALERLEAAYLNHLAGRKQYETMGQIKRILEDRRLVNRYLLTLGFKADIHDSPPALRERAARISATRINEFYKANRERFREVRSVRCRHIHLKSEHTARRVHARLKAGANFAAMARRWSRAADARGPEPGRLPEIRNNGKELPFLHKICLIQNEGKVSFPLRMPGDGWEILLVEKREEFYRPMTAVSVRREIARSLAVRDARDEFQATRARLFRKARIRLHPSLKGAAK